MKQNAKSDKPFTLNSHVPERVNKIGVTGFKSKFFGIFLIGIFLINTKKPA